VAAPTESSPIVLTSATVADPRATRRVVAMRSAETTRGNPGSHRLDASAAPMPLMRLIGDIARALAPRLGEGGARAAHHAVAPGARTLRRHPTGRVVAVHEEAIAGAGVGQVPYGRSERVGVGLAEDGVQGHPLEHVVEHRSHGIAALARVAPPGVALGNGPEGAPHVRAVGQKDPRALDRQDPQIPNGAVPAVAVDTADDRPCVELDEGGVLERVARLGECGRRRRWLAEPGERFVEPILDGFHAFPQQQGHHRRERQAARARDRPRVDAMPKFETVVPDQFPSGF
jgi:hypothetical protein